MPGARKPVVVEVRPEDVSPPASPSKAVRFPVKYDIVAGVSRPWTRTEAWSLSHFEKHARSCRQCRSPYDTLMKGGRLCQLGTDLAEDVAMHVYHRNGQVYSTTREGSRDIRVEVPHSFDSLLDLLKARDRIKRKQRTVPIISYDTRTMPVAYTTAPAVQPVELPYNYTNAYVDMHRSNTHSTRQQRPHPESKRYSTIVVGDDDEYERPRSSSKDEKRGSLYQGENKRKAYVVEVRKPMETSRQTHRDIRYRDEGRAPHELSRSSGGYTSTYSSI